ncbi:MAG: glutamyl-tRNA reductase [Myxococcota bacterium]
MRDANMPFELSVFGISYRSAPFEFLEQAALSGDRLEAFYKRLAESGTVRDAFVVSTCNRTEIYAAGDCESKQLLEVLRETFVACAADIQTEGHCYALSGQAAYEHLFRVACGLDSMMLGENQIVGQMRDAVERASAYFPSSSQFERTLQGAFRSATRARAETEIAQGAVSVASAAVHLASRIFSDMSRRHVLILGAGETGRLAAQHFAKLAPRSITILNRTLEKAEAVAREVGGVAAPLDDLAAQLRNADVVTCAVTSKRAIVDRELVERALDGHRSGSMALLDLGLPRNVDPAVNELANVFVHDLKALERMVDSNVAKRKAEIPRVESIIRYEIDRIEEWERASQAGPLIQALRQSVEHLRSHEVDRVTRNMTDEQRQAVDRATRAVVNKLLHGPTQHIKEAVKAPDENANRLRVINDVFQSLADGRSNRRDN